MKYHTIDGEISYFEGDRNMYTEGSNSRTSRPESEPAKPSKSVAKLLIEYPEIGTRECSGRRRASGTGTMLTGNGDSGGCAFIRIYSQPSVDRPETLPYVEIDGEVVFVVPAEFDHAAAYTELTDPRFYTEGKAFIPEGGDWPDDGEIEKALNSFHEACSEAAEAAYQREAEEQRERELKERLVGYVSPGSPLATVQPVAEEAPMLVDGFMPDNAVSVVYGKLDEFKTTLVYDLAGSVALGTKFQGHLIHVPRPVLIYALEGADAATPRLRAVEAKLRRQHPLWRDFPMLVGVRDRIPETDIEWRVEIGRFSDECQRIYLDRYGAGQFPYDIVDDAGDNAETAARIGRYPRPDSTPWPDDDKPERSTMPLVIIDTLSMALGGDAETGPAAVDFVSRCLDLMKGRPEFDPPTNGPYSAIEDFKAKYPQLGGSLEQDGNYDGPWICYPVASAVAIVHHPTKGGDDFGGHRAIGANTQALYRVHRFGSMADRDRPMKGIITPLRTKDMARPSPLRFEVEVVPVPGAEDRTTVVLKDAAPEVPAKLKPIAKALAEIEADGQGVLSAGDVQACIDKVARNRATRGRYRTQLADAGVLEPVLDEADKLIGYRFHGNA
jgi:hypothetical protein